MLPHLVVSAAEALLRGLEEEAVGKIVQAGGLRSTCEVRRHGHNTASRLVPTMGRLSSCAAQDRQWCGCMLGQVTFREEVPLAYLPGHAVRVRMTGEGTDRQKARQA